MELRPIVLERNTQRKLKSLVKLRVRASNIKDKLWYTPNVRLQIKGKQSFPFFFLMPVNGMWEIDS